MSQSVKNAIQAFIHHVESLENSDEGDGFGFRKEYVQIQEIQMSNQRNNVGSMDVGQMESNLKKNRYKDIVPYDGHRVVLSALEGEECSDYINASNIMGVTGTCGYIASQGPLSTTVNDFWRMIWEYNIEIVFMACRLIEMKKIKCSQYWSSVGTSQEFGDITVFTETEEDIVTECVQRKFRVTKGEEVHYVTQFQYCGWPDHGIPENLGDIRDIMGIMREIRNNSKVPVLIHCSAGCGRTGAIIAVDYAWTLLEEGKFDETFSLFQLICNLREQRVSLVQTPDQYALVNKMLKSLCEERLIMLASHTYENVLLNQEQSVGNVGNNEQAAEDNDYEDIWSLGAISEVKTPILNPKECSITDERYLGKSVELKEKNQTFEPEIDDAFPVYENVAEIQRKAQEDLAQNLEHPSEKKEIHKTIIRIDSISSSKKAIPPNNDVKELPADSLTSSSESSDLKDTKPLASTVHPNEANQTGHKEVGDLVRRGATKIKPKAVLATTATSSPTLKAGTTTVISAARKDAEEARPQSVRSQSSTQDTSRVSLRHPPAVVPVPTSQSQKQQPDTDARGFNRKWSSLKSRGATPVLSLPLYQTMSSTNSRGATPVQHLPLYQTTSSTNSRGTTPVQHLPLYQTTSSTDPRGTTPVEHLPRYQTTSSTNSRGTTPVQHLPLYQTMSSVSSRGIVPVPSRSNQRTSSLRYHGSTLPPASSLNQKTAPAAHPEFYSASRKSMTMRVNPSNNVYDTARIHDNTVVVRSDNGARGRNSSSGNHGNQHMGRESKVVSQAPSNYVPREIPKFGGFVRLNSKKTTALDEGRHHQYK